MIKIKSNRNENLLLSAAITHKLYDQVLFITYQEAEVLVQDAYLAMHHIKARVRPIRMKLAGLTTSTKTFNR
jgi:hypothetical protein